MRGAAPEALQPPRPWPTAAPTATRRDSGCSGPARALRKAGDRAQASALLARAAELDTDGYGGLRARAILDGDTRGRQGPPALDLAAVQPTADDMAALDGWLKGRGLDPGSTWSASRPASPAYQRAALLYRVGVPEWAAWEIQDLGVRWESDPARLYGLARFAADHGDTTLGMRMALAAQKAAAARLPRSRSCSSG